MRFRRITAAAAASFVAVALAGCNQGGSSGGGNAQNYPRGGAIELIAPADPGSGFDSTARAVAEVLQKENLVKVPLTVQNRPGGLGVTALNALVEQNKGRDDVIQVGSLSVMYNKATSATQFGTNDVTMLAQLMVENFAVVTGHDAPFNDLAGLFAEIKKSPSDFPVAAQVDDAMVFGLLAKEAGINPADINFIAYDGGGEQTTALLNGDVKAALAGYSEFKPLLDASELKGLAIVAAEPVQGVDIRTSADQGFDVTIANWRGIYGPPEMPDYAVTYWTDVLKKMVETPAWAEIAKRNQWTTDFKTGAELTTYLSTMQGEVDAGVQGVRQ
jgi:putative tricarboxylic transport membrane protein